MIDDGLRVLAQVHAVDWQADDFAWLAAPAGPPAWPAPARRVGGLRPRRARRTVPSAPRALLGLAPGQSRRRQPACLNWGDSRLGNMIWRDARCACVTDFEAVAIGPPELDLGWWLMFDRWVHETAGVDRLRGEPTREEQRERYAQHAGRNGRRHLLLRGVRGHALHRHRGPGHEPGRGPRSAAADQTIWIKNPASDCLASCWPAEL